MRGDTGTNPVNHRKSVAQPFDGNWHHIALTDQAGLIRIYVDGNLDATTFTYADPVLTPTILSLGGIRRLAGNAAYFTGQIDDVALWGRILTQADIRSIIATGITVDRAAPYLQGDRIQLSARAILSGPPPTYQWKRNGTNVPGATNSTLTIPAIGPGSDGSYEVVINGTETSPALALTYTPDPAAAVSTNLVSWWPGQSIDPAAFPPTTPDPWSGHPLSCQDMDETNLVAGQFGTAFQFDGLTEVAYRTTGFPIAGNPEYSVSLWIKADGTTQNDLRFFAEASNVITNPLFGIGTSANNTDRLRIFLRSDAGTTLVNTESLTPVLDNTWHHVVWTDRNGQARLYIDGQLDAAPLDYNRTAQVFSFNQTSLGAIQRLATSHWANGLVDDVAVWNRALTWTEIQSLKTTGVPAPVSAVPPDVTLQPLPRTLYQGRTATLSIQATGTAPLTFQWLQNGTPVPGATDFTLTLADAQPASTGSYSCVVSNTAGSDTSNAVSVTILPITGLTSGLVSCYPLDDGPTTTVDTLGGQDMTLFNLDPITAYQPAVMGRGITFDGVDDLLIHTRSGTGTDIPLTTREEFTVSFWVNGIGTGQADRRVFSESSLTNTVPLFNIGTEIAGASDVLQFFFRNDAGGLPVNHISSFVPVFDGTWHHVTYTDFNGQGQLFIDGNPDQTLNYTRTPTTLTNVSIGGIARATPSHWFAGTVDQLCAWSRAITPEEALLTYQLTSGQALGIGAIESLTGNRLRLTVNTLLGTRPYRIESTTDLANGPWTPVASAVIGNVSNGVFTAEVPLPPLEKRVFYRATAPW